MTSYSEEGFLTAQALMLEQAIDYLSNLILHVKNDLSEFDEGGIPKESIDFVSDLESEVVAQIEIGKKNLAIKLKQAQRRLEQIRDGKA